MYTKKNKSETNLSLSKFKLNLKEELKSSLNTVDYNKHFYINELKNEITNELKKDEYYIEHNTNFIDYDDDNVLNNSEIENLKIEIINEIKQEFFVSNLNIYKEESNIKELYLKKKINHSNCFDIDFNFMRKCYNNFTELKNEEIIDFIRINSYMGYICHPKQLRNIFRNDINIFISKTKNIYIYHSNKYYILSNFIEKINKFSFDKFKDLTIRQCQNNNFRSNKLLLLVFINNINVGIQLLNKIINYNSKIDSNFSICFCINFNLLDTFKGYINKYITNSNIIFSVNEFGNDIVPSMLAYNEIIKTYKFDYIIKLHTKTDKHIFNKSINYLLDNTLDNLLLNNNKNSSSIGFNYANISGDNYNKKVLNKFTELIVKTEFVPATIFLTTSHSFNRVNQFFKDNYMKLMLQNTYDNNSLNYDNSYVHFTERLFGYV